MRDASEEDYGVTRTTGSTLGAVACYEPETVIVLVRDRLVTYRESNRGMNKHANGLTVGEVRPRDRIDEGREELGR